MSSHDRTPPRSSTPQSIPLRDLSKPAESDSASSGAGEGAGSGFVPGHRPRHSRTRSLLTGRRTPTYARLDDESPTRGEETRYPGAGTATHGLGIDSSPEEAQAFAHASVGLDFGMPSMSFGGRPPAIITTAVGEGPSGGNDQFSPPDNDTTPLTGGGRLQSSLKSSSSVSKGQRHDRSKRSSIRWGDQMQPSLGQSRVSRLGDDLPTLDTSHGVQRKLSTASGIQRLSATPSSSGNRSRANTLSAHSPMARANSILRGISQRVVNLSNDTDMVEQSIRRKDSVRERRPSATTLSPGPGDEETPSAESPLEKIPPVEETPLPPITPSTPLTPSRHPNPLRGKSWGVFGPENPLRKWLCEVLVHPWTEPIILVLIIVHTVLLAVNAAPDAVYLETRTREWGASGYDYAILALFVIYTLECIARTIVSGFISNPIEYSTLNRSLGVKKAILQKAQTLFQGSLARTDTSITVMSDGPAQRSIVRTFTGMPDSDGPGHGKQQQRMRLARRAFLRHSFNRLDFVAVVAYWISFVMQIAQVDVRSHIYVFNMLSCLRILRLLGLTAGTSIILRSLKKAASSLVHVAFLIGFFWLIFGIVGVQSFKSSLRRTCVWVGDDGSGQNFTLNIAPDNIQFCGGYLLATGEEMPWLRDDGQNGTGSPKGYICPIGSLCVESFDGPYNGTVTFDNILQSLELVFVVISSNTFSDLLYYLTDSDYLAAALFFAAGIVVLSLWLVNLLIAVITSSFQIIREESKRSAFATEKIDEPDLNDDLKAKRSHLKKMFDKSHLFWVFVIAFDLIVQAMRSASMSDSRETFIMTTETVVTFVLLLEIILRFICDWRNFFSGKRNWVDLGLAIITCVIQIPAIRNSGQPYAWLTAFQIMRIYRVVLAVKVTRELIMIVFGNIGGLLNLILFVFLFVFLAAILAAQLFRGEFPPVDAAGETVSVQFFDIWNSFIGMYIIFSSENWTSMMYNATQFNLRWNTAWIGAIFFILWFIIANLIVLNMFIAVIQESFDVSEDEKRLQQVKAFLKQKEANSGQNGNLSLAAVFKMGRDSIRHRDALEYGQATIEQLLREAVVKDFLDEQDEGVTRRPTSMHMPQLSTVNPGIISKYWGKITGLNKNREPNPFYSSESSLTRANEDFNPRDIAKKVVTRTENRRRAQRQYLATHPNYNVSLFLFKPNNPIRRMCQYLVGPGRGSERVEGVSPYRPAWYAFTAFTYAAIVSMVILACITTPLFQREYYQDNEPGITNWFVWTDLGFAVLFSLEAIIKIIADGFFFTPHAYFRSVWGFIDGVVLITLWINVITAIFRDAGISRAVGAFKALRALRLLNISDTARDTFYSVIVVGGYKVLGAAFVSLSLLVPFAILGLNLFNGQMKSCNDGDFGSDLLTNCVGEFNSTPYNWPVLAPRAVSNPFYDFDNFGNSLFILFQVVSQEGWTDLMFTGVSITGRGTQPQDFASQGNAVYFIIFNLLGAVFVLTLFISVFMRNYTEQTGVAFLTAEQRSWLELRKLLKQISPSKRSIGDKSASWRKWCYDLSIKKRGKWQRFITVILVCHLCLLNVDFYPEPKWWETLREFIFLGFTLILVANNIIRIVGLSWHRFRRSSWDVYSMLATSGIFVTSLMSVARYDNMTFNRAHKLFLVSVTFLLIPRNNQLDQLFKTAAASLPLIANLLATWFVLFLVFAIALTQTFSLTRFGENENNNVNFRTVPKALVLLFRTSIGEGWNAIMEDFASIEPPFCVQEDSFFDSDCGSASWARSLFILWNIISMYIFVSLFVSMIFESFSYVYQQSSGMQIVSRDEIRRFKQAWADFDPDGTGFISKQQFPRLLGELSGIFQMRIYDGDFTVRSIIDDCSVSIDDPPSPNRRIVAGIDLDKLNERIAQIPVDEIRQRRERMNVFYQEVMLAADPDRGIPFTACLFILTHYNVITDSRSLRLEEFLRRRARLQRVHETIRRNTVVGFFNTMHWARRFRRLRRDSKLAGPLQMPVPEIYVENPDDPVEFGGGVVEPEDFTKDSRSQRQTLPALPPLDTSYGPFRDSLRSPGSPVPGYDDLPASPRTRTRLGSVDTSDPGPARSSPTTPTLRTPTHSRHGSNLDGNSGDQGIVESFESSAWAASIRRSFTTKRRGSKSGTS